MIPCNCIIYRESSNPRLTTKSRSVDKLRGMPRVQLVKKSCKNPTCVYYFNIAVAFVADFVAFISLNVTEITFLGLQSL